MGNEKEKKKKKEKKVQSSRKSPGSANFAVFLVLDLAYQRSTPGVKLQSPDVTFST